MNLYSPLFRGLAGGLILFTATAQAVPPTITNIRASQRAGTKQVDIVYDVADPDSSAVTVQIEMSADSGTTYDLPLRSLSGAVGTGVTPGTNRAIVWNAGLDWNGNFSPTCRVRLYAFDNSTPTPPIGMVYIPNGTFVMGWSSTADIGGSVTLTKPYFMDRYEISGSLWNVVRTWGVSRGYSIGSGSFREGNHPVQTITWSDATVWCNARSEMEGLTPCYYTTAAKTTLMKSRIALSNDMVNWNANGYRLPTEAEWERAARGGLDRKQFPWGDGIASNQANYASSGDPFGTVDPQTTPVGYYNGSQTPAGSNMANGYGLYDMAGNVWEWCWDWSDAGLPLGQTNPYGATTGGARVYRGGAWNDGLESLRCAVRHSYWGDPGNPLNFIGFRVVRGI